MTGLLELPINYNRATTKERRLAREQYVQEQYGLCLFCDMPLALPPADAVREAFVDRTLFPPNFFKYPQHLHHDHDSGLTIGTVHARCNAVLWQYFGE